MHPTASEDNLIKSIGAHLIAAGLNAVNADEYDALSQELDTADTFVAFKVGDGTGTNKEYRELSVAVLTRNDPGNQALNLKLDAVKALFAPGTSVPLLDFVGGGREVVTQMCIRSARTRGMVHEQDDRRSKTLEVELTYPKLY